MSLIYITGVEGSGKSTVCEYLASKGHQAIDLDKEGLSKRFFKHTWKLAGGLPAKSNLNSEWFNEREWKIRPSDLLNIKNASETSDIYICGITENFDDIKQIVDKVICLTLPADEVVNRILMRKNNDFGKNQAQLRYILEKHTKYEKLLTSHGATMIDASQPLSDVVDEILRDI